MCAGRLYVAGASLAERHDDEHDRRARATAGMQLDRGPHKMSSMLKGAGISILAISLQDKLPDRFAFRSGTNTK